MKYSVAFVALAAVAAQAQSLADVPKCALPCLDKAIASETSCDKTDLACVCKDFSKVRSVATSCVIDECGTDVAINEVLPATEGLCKNPPKESEEKPSSKAEEEKPTYSTVVVSTTAAAVETTAAEATTVAPVVPTTSAVAPVVESPSTPAATPSSSEPAQANGAAALKGLGALAMAAFAVLAL